MKALVWRGDRQVDYDEVADPEPADGEAILEVELTGICGSDLHGFRGHPGPRVPPLVLGHEVVGMVGGERFTVYPIIGCGKCSRCAAGAENLCASWQLLGMHRPGTFAEAVAVPRRSLVAVPDELDAGLAVLAEPLACCVAALAPHALDPGLSLVVLGCGPIGLLTTFLAARAGAHVTAIDPLPQRLEAAERLGAQTVRSHVEPGEADLAVDAAGFEVTWRAAIESVRSGGTVVMVGLGQGEAPFPMAAVVRRAITIRGQFGYTRADFARAVEVLCTSALPRDWIAELALVDGVAAFANLVDRPAEWFKVLLRP